MQNTGSDACRWLIPIRIKNDNCVASPCRAAALSAASRLVLLSNANWNKVAQSGPFLRFDCVQHWFAVLGGAGIALTHDGQRHALTVDSAPFCFDGGLPTGCELLDGATQDFNLMLRVAGDGGAGVGRGDVGMSRQARASATMARVRASANVNFRVLPNTIKIVAVYAICKRATVRFNGENRSILPRSLVWRTVASHDVMQISAEDALLIEIDVAQSSVGSASKVAPTCAATDLKDAP